MSASIDTILRQLAETEARLAELNNLRDNLREDLLTEMSKMESDRYTGAFAKVTVCIRRSYEYTHNVLQLQEQLKAEKKVEEKTGIATQKSITFYPRITWTE